MTIKKILSWTAVILWMVLIFHLSSQAAVKSDKLSTEVTEAVVKTVKKVTPKANFDIKSLNHIVRKNAHFFAYLALGILVLNALRRSGIYGYKSIVLALVTCVLYAVSDEVHQIFASGRGPGVKDVFIDSAGAAVGIGIYMFISRVVMWKGKLRCV